MIQRKSKPRFKAARLAGIGLAVAALSACVTNDDLYAQYECKPCKASAPIIAAISTASVTEPSGDAAPVVLPAGVRWEQAVYFEFDRSDVLPREAVRLDQNLQALATLPQASVVVRGFTDSYNNNAYNVALANRRVASVADYLQASGLAAARVIRTPVGEQTALYDRDTSPAKRATNRRVEMILVDADRKPLVLDIQSVESARDALKIGNEGSNGIDPDDP